MALTIERLREVIDYDPITGVMRWRIALGSRGVKGKEITTNHGEGYISVQIDGTTYLGHRLAWFHYYGHWPTKHLDHRDLDRKHNAIANLREATTGQNNANRPVRKDNKLGIKGVRFFPGRKKPFQALVTSRSIGYFATEEEAREAYALAARQRHGEFARV